MAKAGRKRKYPVLKSDYWNRPLKVGDYVNYIAPQTQSMSFELGRIVGKRHGYLHILCLTNNKREGQLHCKHGYQCIRVPGEVKGLLPDTDIYEMMKEYGHVTTDTNHEDRSEADDYSSGDSGQED